MKKRNKNNQRLPKGWTEAQIRALAKYHEEMTEDQQVAEIERAFASPADETVLLVPTELVPEINKLITKKRPA
jgi:hypothetical protein